MAKAKGSYACAPMWCSLTSSHLITSVEIKSEVARVRYSPEICELSAVINHKTEDFISIIKTGFIY